MMPLVLPRPRLLLTSPPPHTPTTQLSRLLRPPTVPPSRLRRLPSMLTLRLSTIKLPRTSSRPESREILMPPPLQERCRCQPRRQRRQSCLGEGSARERPEPGQTQARQRELLRQDLRDQRQSRRERESQRQTPQGPCFFLSLYCLSSMQKSIKLKYFNI